MAIEDDIKQLQSSGISRSKAALALGITREKLDLILDVMNLEWKAGVRGGRHVIDGVQDTLQGHSERLGISVGKLRWRLNNQRNVTAPVASKTVSREEATLFLELRKSGTPAWQAAESVGRPYNTLKNACKRLFPDYEKVVEAAPRIRRASTKSSDPLEVPETLEADIRKLHEEGISRAKASEKLGISYNRLTLILGAIDLEWKTNIRGGTIIDGIQDSLEGHSERLGVSVGKIRSRMKRQRPINGPAFYKPVTMAEATIFMEHRRAGVPAWEAAERVGRLYDVLKHACKRMLPDYEKVVEAAPRIRRTQEEIQVSEIKKAA